MLGVIIYNSELNEVAKNLSICKLLRFGYAAPPTLSKVLEFRLDTLLRIF